MFAELKDDRNLCLSLYCPACALSRKGDGDANGGHRNCWMLPLAREAAAAAEAIRQNMKIPFPDDWTSRLELAMGRDLADPATLPPSRPVERLSGWGAGDVVGGCGVAGLRSAWGCPVRVRTSSLRSWSSSRGSWAFPGFVVVWLRRLRMLVVWIMELLWSHVVKCGM